MKNKYIAYAFLAILFFILLTIQNNGNAADLKANLRFSHKTHNMNSITCTRCHILPSQSLCPANSEKLPPGWQPLRNSNILATSVPCVASDRAKEESEFGRPGEKICLECHFKSRKKSDCALCHLDKPGPTIRKRRRLKKYVIFSHSSHKNIACVTCHKRITGWEDLNGNHIKTRMKFCLKCHNGKKAPKNCTMCHSPIPHPKSHVKNYIKKHGIAYRSNPSKCSMCHQESYCVACHSHKPKSHTLAWIKGRHAFEAKTNPQKCQACHADRWVCKRCHGH